VGTSQKDKEKHHARIVAIAARRVREKGLDGISIADLMKNAGLTHGGFYRHFGSREDLIGDAVECALGQWIERLASEPKSSRKKFPAVIDEYLSISHRNSPETGCAVATLSAEAWRGGKRVRRAYTRRQTVSFADRECIEWRSAAGGGATRFDAGAFRSHWRALDGSISR
jgi:TetR/AcrR family transcriptional regulator, transcriptional repressor for nem operon